MGHCEIVILTSLDVTRLLRLAGRCRPSLCLDGGTRRRFVRALQARNRDLLR